MVRATRSFNLGVALVRSGRTEAAAAILDELGDIDPWNEELMALRDKANLALGYAMLQDGRPQLAKGAAEPRQARRPVFEQGFARFPAGPMPS